MVLFFDKKVLLLSENLNSFENLDIFICSEKVIHIFSTKILISSPNIEMKSKKEEMKICRGAEYFYVAALSILAKSVTTTFSSFLRFAFTKKSRKREGQLKLEILFFSTAKKYYSSYFSLLL